MTNNQPPIDRIDDIITTLQTIREYALECEESMREADATATNLEAMRDAFEILADDIMGGESLISRDDFAKIKSMIMP